MNEIEIVKWVTLFVIQFAGAAIALVSVLHMRLKPFTSITPGALMTWMLWTVVFVLILTACLTLLTPGIGSRLWSRALPECDPPAFLTRLTFELAISLCALVDLLGFAVLIYATGGSRQTVYVPYLFTIVLLIIMLEAPLEIIIICFALSVIIFWVFLFHYDRSFEATRPKLYNIYFGVITSLCVSFPTLVMVVDKYLKANS